MNEVQRRQNDLYDTQEQPQPKEKRTESERSWGCEGGSAVRDKILSRLSRKRKRKRRE